MTAFEKRASVTQAGHYRFAACRISLQHFAYVRNAQKRSAQDGRKCELTQKFRLPAVRTSLFAVCRKAADRLAGAHHLSEVRALADVYAGVQPEQKLAAGCPD